MVMKIDLQVYSNFLIEFCNETIFAGNNRSKRKIEIDFFCQNSNKFFLDNTSRLITNCSIKLDDRNSIESFFFFGTRSDDLCGQTSTPGILL